MALANIDKTKFASLKLHEIPCLLDKLGLGVQVGLFHLGLVWEGSARAAPVLEPPALASPMKRAPAPPPWL